MYIYIYILVVLLEMGGQKDLQLNRSYHLRKSIKNRQFAAV